ncbi:hypothetical protein [Neorhizobium galegae]|uniref:hypothetical protein n=1 Tax=Neorhizobium galegae TaxID=399 RepID=UPI00210338A9|nr:hypothetical protein [Neorhizobium galegae]MCQ1852987.1 hypothetical protein [Neorhizobium galegae]
MTLAIACLSALMLGGCTTTKKTADATTPAPRTTVPASAKGILAKGGTTATNRYVDPAISKGSAQQAQTSPTPAAVPSPENTFPPAPAQPQQASIAGLATQPTGVRADSGTIFSSNPPMAAAGPSGDGPVPANLPRRNFNATTASVYSTPQATRAAACGADAQGNPLSC